MTTEDVRGRVKKIRSVARDPEHAHSEEDKLWEEVLENLAEKNPIAAEALKTRDINFSRWCA